MGKRSAGPKAELTPLVDLEQRVTPTQARAKQTVEVILDTTAELLEEVGIDVFSTNLLAQRAGVGIRTIYRYFPNKLAVVAGLATRLFHRPETWQGPLGALADPNQRWRQAWWSMIERNVEWRETMPGATAIHRAMKAIPELRDVERRESDRLEERLTSALIRRGVASPEAKLRLIVRTCVAVASAMADDAMLRHGCVPPDVVEELELLQERYLSLYLDP